MRYVYFPSCNFAKASPEAAERIRQYLAERMPVAGCCRVDRTELEEGSTALYVCQACRETLEQRFPGCSTKNLFVWLCEEAEFPWPDWSGLTVTVQDCWRDRAHPEIGQAVREALRRMQIRVVEMQVTGAESTFCGNLHVEPEAPALKALLAQWQDAGLWNAPLETQRLLMEEQAAHWPCDTVVTTCNRCTAGVRMAGRRGIHLLELLTGTAET